MSNNLFSSFEFRVGGFMKLYNLIIKDQETTNNKSLTIT